MNLKLQKKACILYLCNVQMCTVTVYILFNWNKKCHSCHNTQACVEKKLNGLKGYIVFAFKTLFIWLEVSLIHYTTCLLGAK